MRKVLLGFLLGTSLLGSLASTRAYGVISEGGFMAAEDSWLIAFDLDEQVLVPGGMFHDEERERQEAAEARAAELVLRAHYLLLRIQETLGQPEDFGGIPAQNRILEAQRQYLQAEWEAVLRDLNFYLEQGWLPWERTRAFLEENRGRMSILFYGAWSYEDDLLLLRWQCRLNRLIHREILPNSRRILEAAAEEALQSAHNAFTPAVKVAGSYRWARYCYNLRAELDRRGASSERFADQIVYWDAQAADEALEEDLWGPPAQPGDLFYEPTPVTLDRVMEIREIHAHYGEQTQIIVDDSELTQPHAHWGDLFEAAQNRAQEFIERGDTRRAEMYMLFALYLKTGNRAWFLLLKSYSDADGQVQEAYALPELNEGTARLFANFLAVYLSNPENPLQDSVYRSILAPYLGSLDEETLKAFLTELKQHLSPDLDERMSLRVGYARLVAECLGSGLFALQPESHALAYGMLVTFISDHLKIKGSFEGEPSLAMILPLIRVMIQPGADLSEHQLGRLLSWVQRMLGGVGFKKLLKTTYDYSDAEIEALVKDALVTIGMIAEAFSNEEHPYNEVIGALFNLFGYYNTATYAAEASEAIRSVVGHWSSEHMESAFNEYCKKKMLKRTWAQELDTLKNNGVIS